MGVIPRCTPQAERGVDCLSGAQDHGQAIWRAGEPLGQRPFPRPRPAERSVDATTGGARPPQPSTRLLTPATGPSCCPPAAALRVQAYQFRARLGLLTLQKAVNSPPLGPEHPLFPGPVGWATAPAGLAP